MIEGSVVECSTIPEKVNSVLPVACPGPVPPFLGLDRQSLKTHEENQRTPRKNLRKVNREIEKFFRYQNIYDYEQPEKGPEFAEDAKKETGAFSLRIAAGGQLVEISRKLGKKPDDLGKETGDVIDGYSRESRNRFIKLLWSINYGRMGRRAGFYTLTYPGEYSNDPRQWKRDLDTFFKRMKREFPDLCGTWRLEPQKRGAPHYSGLLWGCDRLECQEGKEWFSRAWFEVVGSGDEKHLRAGTGIIMVDVSDALIFYMAKYLTKKEKGGLSQEFDYPVGRYWGVINRKKLAIDVSEHEIDRALFFRLRRVGKKLLERRLGKNRFREAVKGKQNGLWIKMDNQTIMKLLTLFVDEREPAGDPPACTKEAGRERGR